MEVHAEIIQKFDMLGIPFNSFKHKEREEERIGRSVPINLQGGSGTLYHFKDRGGFDDHIFAVLQNGTIIDAGSLDLSNIDWVVDSTH